MKARPGILTYDFRTSRLEYHRTVEELAEECLQPGDLNAPAAALHFVGGGKWTPLYSRRTAIPL